MVTWGILMKVFPNSRKLPFRHSVALMGHSDISVTVKYCINVPGAEKIEAIRALTPTNRIPPQKEQVY